MRRGKEIILLLPCKMEAEIVARSVTVVNVALFTSPLNALSRG